MECLDQTIFNPPTYPAGLSQPPPPPTFMSLYVNHVGLMAAPLNARKLSRLKRNGWDGWKGGGGIFP